MNELREMKIGNLFGATGGNYAGNVYDVRYLAPCLNSMGGGMRMPLIVEEDGEYINEEVCNVSE